MDSEHSCKDSMVAEMLCRDVDNSLIPSPHMYIIPVLRVGAWQGFEI